MVTVAPGMDKQAEICETYQLKWGSYSSYMHSCISNSIYSDSHADVALVTTDGHQILAHRFVLSYSSMFLAQVLKLYKKVTTALPLMIVLPPEIDNKSLKILVRYMYSGEAKVQKEILDKVLRGGDILQIKGLYREKEEDKNYKVSQNAQRPASTDQPTPPPLIASTPTPPLLQPPPLVPTSTITTPKPTTQAQKITTTSQKTQPGILKKATPTPTSVSASTPTKILPSSPGSKLIFVQKPKDQQTYSNQRQKVLNFTILQNFDKNSTKKEDGTKQVTILNKTLNQSKNDNEESEVNVKAEPKETNNLQYLMVKDEPIDWTDAEMEIVESKEEIFDDMTVKSEDNTEEHSDESDDESAEVLEFSPLTCELCTATFTIPADWVRHVQTHTDMLPAKRRRRDSTGDTYENDTYPELMCDLCQKSFPTPAEWVRHIQSSHSEFELFLSNKKNPGKKAALPSTSATTATVTTPTTTPASTGKKTVNVRYINKKGKSSNSKV